MYLLLQVILFYGIMLRTCIRTYVCFNVLIVVHHYYDLCYYAVVVA